ncbi:MAG TPA: hypothetical protein VI260_27580 [Blastocatellia bacterium]|jgi:hypothetical protein
MKSVKTFVIALVIGLAGVVYAANGSQASTQSYGLNEADCCVAGASCCTGGARCANHEAK